MTSAPASPATSEAQTCPECGRQFARPAALGAHRQRAHGVAGQGKSTLDKRRHKAARAARAAQVPPVEKPAAMPDEVADLIAAMTDRRDRLFAQLVNIDAERAEVAEAHRRLDKAIRELDGSAKRPGVPVGYKAKKPEESQLDPRAEARVERVAEFLVDHADDLAEGFTGSDVDRRMKANGDGGKPISPERVRESLVVLHDRGVIRLDRRVKGGGKLYKLTRGRNGASAS